jgi:hypothetical protein
MEGVDGVSIAIGGTACTIIGGIIGKVIQARFSRTEITTSPLMVRKEPDLVDRQDCDQRMTKIEADIASLKSDFDKKVNSIYDRINPCATGIAEINGFLKAEHKKGSR